MPKKPSAMQTPTGTRQTPGGEKGEVRVKQLNGKQCGTGNRGLNEEVIKEISRLHDEPIWMEQLRLRALKHFLGMKVPKWAPELGEIDYQSFYYYARPTAKTSDSWDQVPDYIKKTYDRLGVTEAEQKFLSGVS